MIYKWDICEGERTTAFPGSQNHHSVDPQIWASQNCFSCRFQSKWVGTATQSHWHRRKNEKEQYMRNHRNIEKFKLEGTCHLIQLFTQSKASYMGCSGTCQVLQSPRMEISHPLDSLLAQCLPALIVNFFFPYMVWFSHSPTCPLLLVLLLCTSKESLAASSNTFP